MIDLADNVAKIRVVGIGGAGNNAINKMMEYGIRSADFYAVNTDNQPLLASRAENIIQIGRETTQGLGAGSDPSIGEKAAEENRAELEQMCEGVKLLFITAGMGGGTGTGAAPVVAKIAREKGCLTVAVVTKPFSFEGKKRAANAIAGIKNLKKYVDTLIVIPNDKLVQTLPTDMSLIGAFEVADDLLKQCICGMTDLIAKPSLINLDFADLRTIIKDQGVAHMGCGRAKGDNRVIEAVRRAVSSPLLETTIEGARGVIIFITGGEDLTLGQVNEAAGLVESVVCDEANIIFGANIDPALSEEIAITIIATGFGKDAADTYRPTSSAENNPQQAFDILLKPKTSEPAPRPIQPERQKPAPAPEVDADGEEIPSFVKKLFGNKNKNDNYGN